MMETNDAYINVAYICTVLLIPLLPAFLIYRFLPNKTNVSGPFRGLNLQLTGAFAGYFLLVIISIGFLATLMHVSHGGGKKIAAFEYILRFEETKVPEDVYNLKYRVYVRRAGEENKEEIKPSKRKVMAGGPLIELSSLQPGDEVFIQVTEGEELWEFETSTAGLMHLSVKPSTDQQQQQLAFRKGEKQ